MKKEDGVILSQLVGSMRESIKKLEQSFNKKDEIGLNKAKSEIIELQKKINSLVK